MEYSLTYIFYINGNNPGTVDFEAAGFQKPERFIYGDPIETSIENFEGYLRSWSAYRTYLVKNPGM